MFSESFNRFINELIKEYQLTRDEVMRAVDAFGEFRNKIWAYFIVQTYLKKRGLPAEDLKRSIVNRWFPS